MSEQKCGGLILDAIDQLRKRKARPDLDRICHMLERRHGLKSAAVNEELSRLVNEGIVIKVDYKGNTSYRNAAKWVKTKSQFNGSYYNSSDISSAILEAIRIITLPSKEQPQLRSASLHDIEQFLLKRDSQFNINLATLRAILEKEVSKGTLHQLTSGEYVLLKANPTFEVCKKNDGEPLPKQIKIDPAYQENSSNSNDEPIPVRCDYCLLTAAANRKGEAEELLVCKDCGAKAHPSCMEYTKLLYESYPQPQNWQCPDCKTCIVCDETASSDDLLTCSICFRGFHMACHDPPVTTKPSGIWLCADCDTNSADMGRSKKPAIKRELHYDDEFEPHVVKDEFIKSIEQYPSCIPLAKEWSIENVENFFKYIGFEDEAPAFREQEIDGMSLLLMKRLDVLTGLGIKLGPALKIYKHVIKLQSRIDDN